MTPARDGRGRGTSGVLPTASAAGVPRLWHGVGVARKSWDAAECVLGGSGDATTPATRRQDTIEHPSYQERALRPLHATSLPPLVIHACGKRTLLRVL